MNLFLGINGLLLNFIFVIFFINKYPKTYLVLLSAFFIRSLIIIFSNLGFTLPDSGSDMVRYEGYAWILAQSGIKNVLLNFTGFDSNFLSWLLAIIYSLTDRSIMLLQSISLLCSIGTLFLTYKFVSKIWSERDAIYVLWIISLFPTQILYSTLILKEPYIVFFFVLGLYFFFDWYEKNSLKKFFYTLISFGVATMFHGALAFACIVFLMMSLKNYLYEIYKLFRYSKTNLLNLTIIFSIFLLFVIFIFGGFGFQKVKSPENLIDISYITKTVLGYVTENLHVSDGASYPNWLLPSNFIEILLLSIPRVVYFMIGPMIWDIHKFVHVIAVLDGLFYGLILFYLYKYKYQIFHRKSLLAVFIIILTLVILHGFVISNFGTGLRHRYKFFIAFLVLIAPFIPRLKINKNSGPNKF